MRKARIVFCGTSEFAIPALRALSYESHPLLVISQPQKPQGRKLIPQPSELARCAMELDLKVFTPGDINSEESLETVQAFAPELIVTASYGALLKKRLRSLAPLCLNLHPSLLPLLRGATPIQSALLQGFETTGLTIFQMSARMDAGPILVQETVHIATNDNYSRLHHRLANLGAEALIRLLRDPSAHPARPQEESQATYCHKFEREHLRLDWNSPAAALRDQIRAFALEPGAWTLRSDKPLKIMASELCEGPLNGPPGSIAALVKNTGFAVNCADQTLLITQVQPAGKKIMDAWAFQLGARMKPGELIGS